jgi:hypothetical protein
MKKELQVQIVYGIWLGSRKGVDAVRKIKFLPLSEIKNQLQSSSVTSWKGLNIWVVVPTEQYSVMVNSDESIGVREYVTL